MDISTYLDKAGLTQEEFARRLRVSPGLVWQWIDGRTRVTPERAKQIERKTEGAIKRHDLRPDIWEREPA